MTATFLLVLLIGFVVMTLVFLLAARGVTRTQWPAWGGCSLLAVEGCDASVMRSVGVRSRLTSLLQHRAPAAHRRGVRLLRRRWLATAMRR